MSWFSFYFYVSVFYSNIREVIEELKTSDDLCIIYILCISISNNNDIYMVRNSGYVLVYR